jgi:hypothetical protein
MASFDVRGPFSGARIMVLFEGRKVGLFTAEGRPKRSERGVEHGPLSLTRDGNSIVLSFHGPAVIVPDATAYLSIERALGSGLLDSAMEVNVRFEIGGGEFEFDRILSSTGSAGTAPAGSAGFGRASGAVRVHGIAQPVNGFARAGISFTGLGPQKFYERRMLWACFEDSNAPIALELRSVQTEEPEKNESARVLLPDGWRSFALNDLTIETDSVEQPPHCIAASVGRSDGQSFELEGRAECFIPLSRPGPEQSRIYTSLGFASFQTGASRGAGMFEYSRVAESVLTSSDDSDDSDSD